MTDVHSSDVRSKNMRAIRSMGSKAEIEVLELLKDLGIAVESHVKELPGTPDFVVRDHRIAIFVHGCFWHGHGCHLFRLPKNRRDFWENKIRENRNRDEKISSELLERGWRVLTIWECALKGRLRLPHTYLIEQISLWISSAKDSTESIFEISCTPINFSSLVKG